VERPGRTYLAGLVARNYCKIAIALTDLATGPGGPSKQLGRGFSSPPNYAIHFQATN
jgi:hypothetical protein